MKQPGLEPLCAERQVCALAWSPQAAPKKKTVLYVSWGISTKLTRELGFELI